jgi:hypothetical protein
MYPAQDFNQAATIRIAHTQTALLSSLAKIVMFECTSHLFLLAFPNCNVGRLFLPTGDRFSNLLHNGKGSALAQLEVFCNFKSKIEAGCPIVPSDVRRKYPRFYVHRNGI